MDLLRARRTAARVDDLRRGVGVVGQRGECVLRVASELEGFMTARDVTDW
jgi:hypothetical protein